MEAMLPLIIQLLAGAGGGVGAGMLLKEQSLGTLFNALAGLVGGGIGGYILQALGIALGGGGMDAAGIAGTAAGGGVGGAVVMILVGVIKKILGK